MQRNEYVLKNMFGSFFLAAGASYATALSDLIAFISLLPYMRENSRIFCLHRPEKICSIQQYHECFSIGIPMLISAFLAPVLFYTMNTLIIDKLGADGMYIFTVFFQINSLCLLVLSGSNTAILSRVCKNINHKYMNGVNCIYLNFYRA